ncbi:MAG: PEP-CTERM sorting domain-containing protein [Nitrospirota bacterium]
MAVGIAPTAQAVSYTFTTLDYTPTGINDAGDIVGNGPGGGLFYSGGGFTNISAFRPYGINNHGDVVGTNSSFQGALLSGGTITTLQIPYDEFFGTPLTMFEDINDSGQIVGNAGASGGFRSFIYSGSDYTFLASPFGGPFYNSETFATGINNHGDIVGTESYRSGSEERGVLVSGGITTSIRFPDAYITRVEGVNDAGQVVGLTGGYNIVDGLPGSWWTHGFVWSEGIFSTVDVPGAISTHILDLNNSGQLVGTYQDASGMHGFIATPVQVPEPSGLLLLSSGIVGLIALRNRCLV